MYLLREARPIQATQALAIRSQPPGPRCPRPAGPIMGRVALRIFVVAPSAMLTDHRPHGDGLVAFGFIEELARRGHELHVAAGRVELRGGVPPGVRLYPIGAEHLGKRERLRFMVRLRRTYRRVAASTRLDLIHQLTPVEVGVSLALADAPVPVVLGPYVPDWAPSGEGADSMVSAASLRTKRVLRAAQQRRATTVLLSTPEAAAKVEPGTGKRLNVRELPLGVDDRKWVPTGEDRPGQDVLFLANLEVRKGIYVILDAFARLAQELPEARLLVAGGGPESGEVRRRVRTSPTLARVELLGHVERGRVRAAMQACDVYCLPSYGDPNPLAVLEAMACARPVVATNAGGLRYLVSDRGGRKVPPGDPAALAGALRELLGDAGLRRAMGSHNRTLVEERYAWPRVGDRLEDLYREALRQPRTVPRPAAARRRKS
jgi:L-malate glycosyltransferase